MSSPWATEVAEWKWGECVNLPPVYISVFYLSLCALWLVSDRASCSEESATWELYLLTSPGFLAEQDIGVLAIYTHTCARANTHTNAYILFSHEHNQTHPIRSRHPHCGANVPVWTCVEGGGVVIQHYNQCHKWDHQLSLESLNLSCWVLLNTAATVFVYDLKL